MTKQLKLTLQRQKLSRSLLAIEEKREQLTARRKELEDKLERAAELTDEELTQLEGDIDALTEEENAGNLDEQQADLERQIGDIEKELDEIGKPAPETKPAEINDTRSKGEYTTMIRTKKERIAFYRDIFHAVENTEEFKEFAGQIRSLVGAQERGVTNAHITIPNFVLSPIREMIYAYSKLLKYVNLNKIKGTARQLVAGTTPEAVWTEMDGALNGVNIAFNAVDIDGFKVAAFIAIPNYVIDDSDLNMIAESAEAIGAGIGLGIDKVIVYGVGVKQPLGIVTRLANASSVREMGQYAPTWTDLTSTNIGYLTSADLTATAYFQELATGLAKAQSAYGNPDTLFWAMSKKTWTTLQTKLISLNAAGAFVTAAEKIMPIVGGKIEELNFMPDNVIAGGYGNLYLMGEREGTTLETAKETLFIQDMTVVKGVARYDGAPVIGEGFAMFTLATSSGATEIPFAEDVANKTDAYLTALSGTGLTLSPTFDEGVLAYTASVANGVTSTTITATPRTRGKAVIKVGGQATTGGVCALAVGANTITVDVTYGTSKQQYVIVVTRAGT